MNKTEDIFKRLQGRLPDIDNPDELTERIMESLPDMDGSKGKGYAVIKVLRIISSIAAVWLIGLFIHLHAPVTPNPHQSDNINPYYTSHLSSGNTLKNVYTGALRQKDSHQLSYTHLRKMLYENK